MEKAGKGDSVWQQYNMKLDYRIKGFQILGNNRYYENCICGEIKPRLGSVNT